MISKGQILKYTLLPGIIPRLFTLFGSGFANIAFLIAQVYGNLRLLPPSHPYLQPENFGRFSVRQIIAAAAGNLVFSMKNIDQIIVFFTVLIGLVLIIFQAIIFAFAIFSQPVLAAAGDTTISWFTNTTVPADNDLAFIIMDRVFGTKGIFNSCISTMQVCQDYRGNPMTATTSIYPYPFHKALHTMLSFYSYGIFYVATIILLYYVVTITAETAVSGTPFGKRLNKTWTIPRLILFFALLMPLNAGDRNAGLNAAQLITLNVAKFGSNFATNSWVTFNEAISGTYLGKAESLIASPQFPESSSLLQFMFVARTCQIAETAAYPDKQPIDAYIVRSPMNGLTTQGKAASQAKQKAQNEAKQELYGSNPPSQETIAKDTNYQKLVEQKMSSAAFQAEVKKNVIADPGPTISKLNETYNISEDHLYELSQESALKLSEYSYPEAQVFSNFGNIAIRFGHKSKKDYPTMAGNVNPLCGEININVNDATETGSRFIQENYFVILQALWMDPDFALAADCLVRHITPTDPDPSCSNRADDKFIKHYTGFVKDVAFDNIATAIEYQIEDGNWTIPPELKAQGWGGAALWYNRIAQMNGSVTTAVFNFPRPSSYPFVMEVAAQQHEKLDSNPSPNTRFAPRLESGKMVEFSRAKDQPILTVLNNAYTVWAKAGAEGTKTKITANVFSDTINTIFGTSGIFDMYNNTDIHPLAQLSSIGRGLMEATVRNALFAFAGSVTGGLGGVLNPFLKTLGDTASGTFKSLVFSTMALGFTLYYVVPMLPYIYFIFAISGWVKSIFEAIVAMPLWALGHLRIDGQGLPGQAANNGYFLLFEIFLRPVLILFGLLASITIFAAMVSTLNEVFGMVANNVGGFNTAPQEASDPTNIEYYRTAVDQFFFTVMYVIICYMMGLACFKLIDMIPNKILRWMGFAIATFQEDAGDPASKFVGKSFQSAQKLGFTLERLGGNTDINVAEIS